MAVQVTMNQPDQPEQKEMEYANQQNSDVVSKPRVSLCTVAVISLLCAYASSIVWTLPGTFSESALGKPERGFHTP